MMTREEFVQTSAFLEANWTQVPEKWYSRQNDAMDSRSNLFMLPTKELLEQAVGDMPFTEQEYWRHRWYNWQFAMCDEYLFSQVYGVVMNPDERAKEYDAQFGHTIAFDVKSTRVFRDWHCYINEVLAHPDALVNRYYKQQSREQRYGVQNRLFVVHHSFIDPRREYKVRCQWREKSRTFRTFAENVSRIRFFDTDYGVKAGVIFILEHTDSTIETRICGL